jgi:hypothetical protein
MINKTEIAVIFDADNGVALGSGKRQLYISLQSAFLEKFDKVSTVGNLTFVDVAGKGLINEMYSVDNISNVNW